MDDQLSLVNTKFLKRVQELIQDIEKFIYSDNNPQKIASYLLGVTMFRDDYDEIIKNYPEIEKIAEQASDLESEKDDSQYLMYDLTKIRFEFERMKIRYAKSDEDRVNEESKIIGQLKESLTLKRDELIERVLEISLNNHFEFMNQVISSDQIIKSALRAKDISLDESRRDLNYQILVLLIKDI